MILQFAGAPEVPLDGRAGLAVTDARLDHVERSCKSDNCDLGVGDRLPVPVKALAFPKDARKDEMFDAMFLPQARNEDAQGVYREPFAESVVDGFGWK